MRSLIGKLKNPRVELFRGKYVPTQENLSYHTKQRNNILKHGIDYVDLSTVPPLPPRRALKFNLPHFKSFKALDLLEYIRICGVYSQFSFSKSFKRYFYKSSCCRINKDSKWSKLNLAQRGEGGGGDSK